MSTKKTRNTAGNIIFTWEDSKITYNKERNLFIANITSIPKIFNRKKYPHIDISNSCTIKIKDTNEIFEGNFVGTLFHAHYDEDFYISDYIEETF